MTGLVRVRLFATARAAVGRSRLSVAVPTDGLTTRELVRRLSAAHPNLGPILPHCRYVRNGRSWIGPRARLRPGDEVGVHPPYSGG